jgi:hypothetical protein
MKGSRTSYGKTLSPLKAEVRTLIGQNRLSKSDPRVNNFANETDQSTGSCVSWTPLLRGVIRDATDKAQSGDMQREALEEAIGLLDIVSVPLAIN